MKRINISKNRLSDLYLRKKLSTEAIGKILGCNHVTVLNHLKKYGIPRRSRLGNRRPVGISKDVLFDLYHHRRLSQKQIAQMFGHSRYGIHRRMKICGIQSRSYSVANTKYPKYDFRGDLIEKAYLIGFRLGDLNVYKVHELIQARCSTTKQEQADLIRDLFKDYSHIHIWKARRGTLELIVLLNQSFEFLLPKNDSVERWVADNDRYFLSFLAGYADAEGSYYLRKPYYKKGKVGWGVFEIQTYDKNILQIVSQKLTFFGIENIFSKSRTKGYIDKRGVKTNQDAWRLTVVKKQSLWNYIKLIEPYHRHKNKLGDLKKLKNNLLLRNQLPYCRPIAL